MRWCCISQAEQKKCEQWALNINSDPLVCVRALSVRDCIMKIKVRRLNHISQSLARSSFHYTQRQTHNCLFLLTDTDITEG